MEQDQNKRNEDAALGHDPFADMTWETESPIDEPEAVPETAVSEAAALTDELPDDMDDLEKMLFDDELEISLIDEPIVDETAVSEAAALADELSDDIDDFEKMLFDDEPIVDETAVSEAAALADELSDDIDDFEKILFDDEPEISLTDEPIVDETAVSPESLTDDLFDELDDLESILLGDEELPALEVEWADDAANEPTDEPFITPPAPLAPPVAEELKAAMLDSELEETDALEVVMLDDALEETAVSSEVVPDLESELTVKADETPDIDALLQRIDNEIESINDSVQHEYEEGDAPLELWDLEETAVFDEDDAEPEDSRYLDDLIANIDDQIDALYGTEDSIDVSGEKTNIPGQEEQHVIFHLADTEYTVPIGNVTEIGRPLPTTIVPNVPGWMVGVANLRGDIVSMVDLRGFLGLPPAQFEQDGRMIIAQSTDEDVTAGLLVDRVSGIRFLAVEDITAPTAAIEDQVAPYLRGVYEDNGRLLVVLNLDKLLLSSEMQRFESI